MLFSSPQKPDAERRIHESVLEILKGCQLLSLASADEKASPTCNYAYFVYDKEFSIYFISEEDALHVANLRKNPQVSCAFHIAPKNWGENLQGLRLDGTCERLEGMSVLPPLTMYAQRFNAFKLLDTIVKAYTSGHDEGSVFKITPMRGKILDETRFGFREYIDFDVKR